MHDKLSEPIKKQTFNDLGNIVYVGDLAIVSRCGLVDSSPGFLINGVTDADLKAAIDSDKQQRTEKDGDRDVRCHKPAQQLNSSDANQAWTTKLGNLTMVRSCCASVTKRSKVKAIKCKHSFG